jgi:hypothetical protein
MLGTVGGQVNHVSCFRRSAVVGLLVSLGAVADESSPLKCNIGPITKIYGASKWLVYSCDDNRSLVIVSTPDSVAARLDSDGGRG